MHCECMIPPTKFNTSIAPHIYLFPFLCVRMFNFCSLSRFNLYNTTFLAIVIMCYTLDPQTLFFLQLEVCTSVSLYPPHPSLH